MSKDIQALANEKYPLSTTVFYLDGVTNNLVMMDKRNAFIEGSKLAIDTNPLVKALDRAIGVIETECDDDKLIEELKSALNNVQVVQPAKTDGEELEVDLDDPFIKKHLANIWEKTKQAQIRRFIDPMYSTLQAASISHFLESGKVSGSFHQALNKMMDAVKSWGKIEIMQPHTDKQEGMRWSRNNIEQLIKESFRAGKKSNGVNWASASNPDLEYAVKSLTDKFFEESPSIGADNGREAK